MSYYKFLVVARILSHGQQHHWMQFFKTQRLTPNLKSKPEHDIEYAVMLISFCLRGSVFKLQFLKSLQKYNKINIKYNYWFLKVLFQELAQCLLQPTYSSGIPNTYAWHRLPPAYSLLHEPPFVYFQSSSPTRLMWP